MNYIRDILKKICLEPVHLKLQVLLREIKRPKCMKRYTMCMDWKSQYC